MRIVGGTLRGRRFQGPPNGVTRPTSERVREALTSALVSRDAIAGANVLDLFAGTGALGFEALSRGAERATFVDSDARVVRALNASAKSLGVIESARILKARVGATLPRQLLRDAPFDLVFIDPPYAEIDEGMAALRALVPSLASGAIVVVEHAKQAPPKELPLPVVATYEYGVAALAFLENP